MLDIYLILISLVFILLKIFESNCVLYLKLNN